MLQMPLSGGLHFRWILHQTRGLHTCQPPPLRNDASDILVSPHLRSDGESVSKDCLVSYRGLAASLRCSAETEGNYGSFTGEALLITQCLALALGHGV